MGAIGLNPIRLDRIGLDPIRINAIKLGVPGAASGTDRPYIDPEVLASLKAVCICYGKSNDDPDRAVVKNLVDPDNPFVISNAAFKLNSGFGEHSADFESFDWAVNISQKQHNKATISLNGRLCNHTAIEVDEMKVNIIGNVTELIYWYIANPDDTTRSEIRLTSGINTLPKSYAKDDGQTYNIGFAYISGDSEITIEQIPSFEGAFVTDGIDDLITSTKTVQEMLGGSNEITVVSMIHQVKDSANNVSFTNYIRGSANGYFRNIVNNYGKTGIYGYTSSDFKSLSVINNILGDKNDYTSNGDNRDSIINGNFSVQGYSYNDGNNTGDFSSVAWYWTIIANKVLTTDQINQVIAYFNLDRTLNPDILCNTIKQGITNENHAEFGDKLIDFSGNGRDIQLNNIGWKGDSGIGKYEVDFLDWVINSPFINERTSFTFSSSNDTNNDIITIYQRVPAATQSFKIKAKLRGRVLYRYYVNNGDTISISYYEVKEGINILPDSADPTSVNGKVGFVLKGLSSVKVEQVPFHAGALCLDGVNDFGKVIGMPVYKDYTVVTDREIFANIGAISSKNNPGAFVETAGNSVYSFGQATSGLNFISIRSISYLSKYSYCGQSITAGAAEDGTDMWLGTIRDNDSRFFNGAIYSLMSFPYSMSEFLIERQLKKHKLGTLYPDMVEFRPIVKSNNKWDIIEIWQGDKSLYRPTVNDDKTGIYLKKDSTIGIYVKPKDADEVTKIVVNGTEYTNLKINSNGFYYVTLPITKSPQKINITIDEYIRYEDIVQPYPSFVKLENLDRTYTYTWGDKLKVGDTIRYNSSVNLLEGAYTLKGQLECNGVYVYDNNQHITVAKEMIFAWTNNPVWSIDNNEPKCILSPRLLRIPNSSYKILGHIPDISGHGNHGKINNSAYAGMSGANGYSYDYNNSSFWSDSNLAKVVSGELVEYFAVKNSTGFSNITSGVYKGKIKVTGVTKAISENKISRLRIYTNSTTDNELIDITQDGNYNIDIKGVDNANRVFFYAIPINPNNTAVVRLTEPIYIEQIGEYEGAYCLDGVDDFVTIPTTVGGKQVLMKVNWQSIAGTAILYDQRTNGGFAIFNRDFDTNENKVPAYRARNIGGSTYIDGILNEYIYASELKDITHNIVELYNPELNIGTLNPKIGSSYLNSNYTQMSLYDFMLFDNISTDDKIKELNEYVGIEGDVWGILTQLSNSTLISNETLIKNE